MSFIFSAISAIFTKACQTASALQCSPLVAPQVIQTEPEYNFEVVPMKKMEGVTKIKTAIELIKYCPEESLELELIVALISEKKYKQLPGSLALKDDVPVSFTMQLVFRKVNDREFHVLRHFSSNQKIDSRLLKAAVMGDLYIIDYGKIFRTGSMGCQFSPPQRSVILL